jgi:hypothetical protein
MKLETLTLYVASSSGKDGYAVTFDLDYPRDGLIVECDCPAGRNNTPCKHRNELIKGDRSIYNPQMYYDDGFPDDEWEMLREIVKRYGLDTMVNDYEKTMGQLTQHKKEIDAQIRSEKKALARKFSEGVKRV